ncbi:MAG: hypothetical protein JXB43_08600 [Dehalococcoidia bacterium]|nr:hypothetical protein [Dehalococcoidia bacterium]
MPIIIMTHLQGYVKKEGNGGCQNVAEVILYAIDGGGPTWPGGLQYLPE